MTAGPATPATPRIVYSDLDGTLLGQGGSLFRDSRGEFTMSGAQALALIASHGAQLSLVSGRSARLLHENARMLGAGSFIAEAGCLLVRDGREIQNCQPFGATPGMSVFAEITRTGAPQLLLNHFGPALAYHDPWHADHLFTHLMRGCIDTAEADALLADGGMRDLKVVDNGVIEDRGYGMPLSELHAYHLMPAAASKGTAIARDLELQGLARSGAVACGDSDQDLEMARAVKTLYLMHNARANCSRLESGMAGIENIVIVEAPMVEGFLAAMKREFGNAGPVTGPRG